MEKFQERFGVRILQGWGMTETSPLCAVGHPPRGVAPGTSEEMDWRALTGRVIAGVELRIVDDDGVVLPWDGDAVGEIQVRGPWITASYYGDPAPEKFDDGWLRTGDIASVTPNGFIRITDRSKDVIKSGGEWISSVELEGHLMAHPDVVEAAVIAVPDPRWDERPLACVVLPRELGDDGQGAVRVPRRARGQVAAPGAVDLHRRGTEDERRQVRQEGAPRAVRRRRAPRGGAPVAPTLRFPR